jgi:hypothetical protein
VREREHIGSAAPPAMGLRVSMLLVGVDSAMCMRVSTFVRLQPWVCA